MTSSYVDRREQMVAVMRQLEMLIVQCGKQVHLPDATAILNNIQPYARSCACEGNAIFRWIPLIDGEDLLHGNEGMNMIGSILVAILIHNKLHTELLQVCQITKRVAEHFDTYPFRLLTERNVDVAYVGLGRDEWINCQDAKIMYCTMDAALDTLDWEVLDAYVDRLDPMDLHVIANPVIEIAPKKRGRKPKERSMTSVEKKALRKYAKNNGKKQLLAERKHFQQSLAGVHAIQREDKRYGDEWTRGNNVHDHSPQFIGTGNW
jgi:hypothetical protein